MSTLTITNRDGVVVYDGPAPDDDDLRYTLAPLPRPLDLLFPNKRVLKRHNIMRLKLRRRAGERDGTLNAKR
jgi:hypothetical protein